MDNLAELDDCIKDLEDLQLTLDTSPTLQTKSYNPSSLINDLPQKKTNHQVHNNTVSPPYFSPQTTRNHSEFDQILPDSGMISRNQNRHNTIGRINFTNHLQQQPQHQSQTVSQKIQSQPPPPQFSRYNNTMSSTTTRHTIDYPDNSTHDFNITNNNNNNNGVLLDDFKSVNVPRAKLSANSPLHNRYNQQQYNNTKTSLNSPLTVNTTIDQETEMINTNDIINDFPPPPPPIIANPYEHQSYVGTTNTQSNKKQDELIRVSRSDEITFVSQDNNINYLYTSSDMTNQGSTNNNSPISITNQYSPPISTANQYSPPVLTNQYSSPITEQKPFTPQIKRPITNLQLNSNNNQRERIQSQQSTASMSSQNQDPNKTVVRFFCSDKTTKALMIDDLMTIESIIRLLMEKSFWTVSPQSAIVEKVPCLKMERFFEEQEYLLNCINNWPNTCANMVFFEPRTDIYGMFENAKKHLGDNYQNGALTVEIFKNLHNSVCNKTHNYQDYLYIKKQGENIWKRKFCILKSEGIYAIPKKKAKSQKETIVMSFNDRFHLYTTTGGWTKEWNAPTPFGFAFKPYSTIDPKSPDLILFCASDELSMNRWCSNLRLCKFGEQIFINYEQMRSRSMVNNNSSMLSGSSPGSLLLNRAYSLSPGSVPYHSLSRASLPTNSSSGMLFTKNSNNDFLYSNSPTPTMGYHHMQK